MSRTPSRPSTPAPMTKPGASGSTAPKAAPKLSPQPAPRRLIVPKPLGPQPAPKRLTPSGATAGGSKPATLTGAPKQAAPSGKPLSAPAVGGAKTVTPFKSAGPSNPMGRTGGKPGVVMGNEHRR